MRWYDRVMALRTPICDLLGIEFPIVLAGMGGASTPKLAAAVSNAGGLGILGAAGCQPDELRAWIAETRRLTSKPFGVDTLLPASVRRSKPEGAKGPSPMDALPKLQSFAREFMEKEGLVLRSPAPAEPRPKPARAGCSRSARSSSRPRWRSWSRTRSGVCGRARRPGRGSTGYTRTGRL